MITWLDITLIPSRIMDIYLKCRNMLKLALHVLRFHHIMAEKKKCDFCYLWYFR